MASSAMVHVRVDVKLKKQADAALAAMGLSVSDAVRMMLTRVSIEKALPFEVKVPNAKTVKAMKEADKGKGKRYKTPEEAFRALGI